MKRFSITMAALFMGLVLSSCASSVGTLKGQYPAINTVTTNSSFEDVWSRVIDFFAENNIPIGTIAKDSGIITATNIRLGDSFVSYEDKNGKIVNPNAWFVVPYMKEVVGARADCSFNVRVKKNSDGGSTIQVNLSNILGYYNIQYLNTLNFKKEIIEQTHPRPCHSTGQFEKSLLELFK